MIKGFKWTSSSNRSDLRWDKFELHELHIFAAAVSEFGPHDPTDPVIADLAGEIDDEITRRQR